ncbi:MAG: glycosyltransferase [Flavobacteriaceae bacterium]|nr:glycosyltransferase [Flavobacteriaceae bacterium]
MRIGVNPEKYKGEKNTPYSHRIVIPVYIPNIHESYYQESIAVLDYCLTSVIQTINPQTTAITLINNNSTTLINEVIEKHLPFIDKLVTYTENKGKVYAVINEVRSVFEPFVTIADADVLFMSGWEQAVFEIFNNYPNAGAITPLPTPNSAYHLNTSVYFDHFLFGKMKYDKIVADEDIDLYLQGLNNSALINRKGKFNWREKQYFLDGKIKAVVGALHFVTTYKSAVFRNQSSFPEIKFINGYETEFIDKLPDLNGLYRLSTVKTFAYHIGNKVDDFVIKTTFDNNMKLDSDFINNIKTPAKSLIPYWIKSLYFRALKRIMKL